MKRIFLVEDDPAIREVLEIFLISENYEVKTFGSVNEFANRDIINSPDLYLFDVMLPDGSGIDLCKEIKNNVNIPVIIMSAHARLYDIKKLCEPDDIIVKPFDIDDVLKRIEKVLV